MRLVFNETKEKNHPYAISLINEKKVESFGFGEESSLIEASDQHPENHDKIRSKSMGKVLAIETFSRFGKMVAKSDSMRSVFGLARKVARFDTTVLVTGESGTGKELIARGIHEIGNQAGKPFIPVNCGGIPETLLESEFFGYRKGAFTGADRTQKGLFEEADGGTIFLDEIGELPMVLQVKLLRVLQEKEIRRIGESQTRKVDVRVIAATSKDLISEVKSGAFRKDLFYRLNVLPIKLPSLRERTEDIPLLSRHIIARFRKKMGVEIRGISGEAMSILVRYPWPGNVRELENVLERAIVISGEPVLSADIFARELHFRSDGTGSDGFFDGLSIKSAQQVLERKLISLALVKTKGNRSKATRLLGISHPSLIRKIREYKINL